MRNKVLIGIIVIVIILGLCVIFLNKKPSSTILNEISENISEDKKTDNQIFFINGNTDNWR